MIVVCGPGVLCRCVPGPAVVILAGGIGGRGRHRVIVGVIGDGTA